MCVFGARERKRDKKEQKRVPNMARHMEEKQVKLVAILQYKYINTVSNYKYRRVYVNMNG